MKKHKLPPKILQEPEKPPHLPDQIHWLSGEGAGSWFHIIKKEKNYLITRFDPKGKLECMGLFKQEEGKRLRLNENYSITYLSHCSMVNIIQNHEKLKFNLLEKCYEY